ncbi:MAG: efflux RND transporter periplasmic adaptor subunit [Acidobacteriota bacterium]
MNQDDNAQQNAEKMAAGKTSRLRKQWVVVALAIIGVAAVASMFIILRPATRSSTAGRAVAEPTIDPFGRSGSMPSTTPRPGEMIVTITADKLRNAQLKIEEATLQQSVSAAGGMRATGVVQSNAYKEIPVLPIAGGIVRQVRAELGERVQAGQPLAVIFSTELAEAQTAYLKMLADVEEHHQHHRRTIELVEIGAASREELEQATARYKTAQAELASARQRLLLLGMTEKRIDDLRSPEKVAPLITVESPASGTVISRSVNVGEVVMEGKELFRVADLSSVWVIGQVYENDFALVRTGTQAAITAPAFPGKTFTGRVSYIDPRVDPATRTAQVRVEVSNPSEMLRLGMFVDVRLGDTPPSGSQAVMVPRSAVQSLGAKQVVYVATGETGVFIQRDVTTGAETNGLVPVYSGLTAGERVVTEGSFLLRAESFKLNPAQTSASSAETSAGMHQHASEQEPAEKIRTIRIEVSEKGFEPSTIRLKKGVLARLIFVRKVEVTCATEVVIEEFGIKQELPLNEPAQVELTPNKAGEFSFACGMNMIRGKIVVR